jgi:hypothetical protein
VSGTSEYAARIRTSAALVYGAADMPVGNLASRTLVANNLNHYQDIYGQCRMTVGARVGGAAGDTFLAASTTEWELMTCTGAFPIAMREDGTSYRVRVEIGAAMEGAGPAGRVAVVLAPIERASAILNSVFDPAGFTEASTDSVWISDAITGTSIVYVTGNSYGPRNWDRMVYLTADEASQFVVPIAGLTNIAGDAAAGPGCLVNLSVWGSTATPGTDVRVHAACLTEWVG